MLWLQPKSPISNSPPAPNNQTSIKITGKNCKPCYWGSEGQVKFLSLAFMSSSYKHLNVRHFCRTQNQRTLFMVFYNLIYRAEMSNESDRRAEREVYSLLLLVSTQAMCNSLTGTSTNVFIAHPLGDGIQVLQLQGRTSSVGTFRFISLSSSTACLTGTANTSLGKTTEIYLCLLWFYF